MAPALGGVVEICEDIAGGPGCFELSSLFTWIEDGKKRGEKKERRYSVIKKSPFEAQTVESTPSATY